MASNKEYRKLLEQTGLIRSVEDRMANVAREMEAMLLIRIADRVRSDECHGMNRQEIAAWLESMTYNIRASADGQNLSLALDHGEV